MIRIIGSHTDRIHRVDGLLSQHIVMYNIVRIGLTCVLHRNAQVYPAPCTIVSFPFVFRIRSHNGLFARNFCRSSHVFVCDRM